MSLTPAPSTAPCVLCDLSDPPPDGRLALVNGSVGAAHLTCVIAVDRERARIMRVDTAVAIRTFAAKKAKPPICPPSPIEIERGRRARLVGWVVGWGDLFVDEDGWLVLREDAAVFSTFLRALVASFAWPIPVPLSLGRPRRTSPHADEGGGQ